MRERAAFDVLKENTGFLRNSSHRKTQQLYKSSAGSSSRDETGASMGNSAHSSAARSLEDEIDAKRAAAAPDRLGDDDLKARADAQEAAAAAAAAPIRFSLLKDVLPFYVVARRGLAVVLLPTLMRIDDRKKEPRIRVGRPDDPSIERLRLLLAIIDDNLISAKAPCFDFDFTGWHVPVPLIADINRNLPESTPLALSTGMQALNYTLSDVGPGEMLRARFMYINAAAAPARLHGWRPFPYLFRFTSAPTARDERTMVVHNKKSVEPESRFAHVYMLPPDFTIGGLQYLETAPYKVYGDAARLYTQEFLSHFVLAALLDVSGRMLADDVLQFFVSFTRFLPNMDHVSMAVLLRYDNNVVFKREPVLLNQLQIEDIEGEQKAVAELPQLRRSMMRFLPLIKERFVADENDKDHFFFACRLVFRVEINRRPGADLTEA